MGTRDDSLSGPRAIPFEAFMDRALYGDDGFYIRRGAAGRRGDFLTSPEVGPLFGAVVANFLDAEWQRLDAPSPFTVVDAGAGPGSLARAVLAAEPACAPAVRYIAVELSPEQRRRHPAGVESTDRLPPGPIDGVIIANELLDNLPFRLAVFDGDWREAYVGVGAGGEHHEILSAPFDPRPRQLPANAPHGARAPLLDRAADFVADARGRLGRGCLLAIDYGVPATADLVARPWRDWLRTYRANEGGDHYLRAPGTQDITTEVPFDQLPEPDSVSTQAEFLRRWGIEELVDEGKRVWRERAAAPDVTAMRMRSRVGEAEALLDPDGLGAFLVAQWRTPA